MVQLGSKKVRPKYWWCLHCQGVSEESALKPGPFDPGDCPYPDCDGAFWDLIPWPQVLKAEGDLCTLPDSPEPGKKYFPLALFGVSK